MRLREAPPRELRRRQTCLLPPLRSHSTCETFGKFACICERTLAMRVKCRVRKFRHACQCSASSFVIFVGCCFLPGALRHWRAHCAHCPPALSLDCDEATPSLSKAPSSPPPPSVPRLQRTSLRAKRRTRTTHRPFCAHMHARSDDV